MTNACLNTLAMVCATSDPNLIQRLAPHRPSVEHRGRHMTDDNVAGATKDNRVHGCAMPFYRRQRIPHLFLGVHATAHPMEDLFAH